MAFLENFSKINKVASNINWPKKPNFILTSYGHYNDEIFKSYCAHQEKKGSKLFVFQHGAGGIFSDKEFFALRSDLNTSNSFLSWEVIKKKISNRFFTLKKFSKKKI